MRLAPVTVSVRGTRVHDDHTDSLAWHTTGMRQVIVDDDEDPTPTRFLASARRDDQAGITAALIQRPRLPVFRDGDRVGVELGCEPECARGIVHRRIRDDGKVAIE